MNGHVLGYGPARFHPAYPEFDQYDLSGPLRSGENVIRVEVNSRGADCYQAMPGRGGLALDGHADGLSLSLPSGWRVLRSTAWDSESEPYSFAQGPVEICDTRALPSELDVWLVPEAVAGPSRWGKLGPRSIAAATQEILRPSRIIKACEVSGGTFRVGFRCTGDQGQRQPFFTYLFSPHAQEVEAGVFWGPMAIHGQWLHQTACLRRGNRESVILPLHPGWNFVYGIPEILKTSWPWMMELPDNCGLKAQGLPETSNLAAFCVGSPLPPGSELLPPPHGPEALPGFPVAWPPANTAAKTPSPARELAWDDPGTEILPPGSAWVSPVVLPQDRASTLVLDFGREYLGHAFVEVDAPASTVMDIGYEERLTADGMPGYYRCNPFVNSADRFVLQGGPQRIEAFHERGGRYLQITFRNVCGPLVVREVGIRSSCGDYPFTGRFQCGDADLDWAWEAGDRTLRTSMADGWIDPWRERGLYIGDALVQGHATRKITSDWRLDPWCLRLWARSQYPDGQLPDVVPAPPHRPLCDYSLIWIIALRNYWAALVEEVWETIPRIFSSPVWKAGPSGLWEVTPDTKIFVDWGVVPEEREGLNAALNAFRIRALACASELASAVRRDAQAASWKKEADDLASVFRGVFWIPELGRFSAAVLSGKPFEGPALHANALALAFGLCDPPQQPTVADYVCAGVQIGDGLPAGRCELYFLYYVLDGLYRAGRAREAENAMRAYYGFMRQRGAWTLWETLREGAQGRDSMCHGWSSGAIPYLSERVLGVRPAVPGNPAVMLVAPEAETLDRAEGVVPHPAGPIAVRWSVEGDVLRLRVVGPEGVDIECRPQGRLGQLKSEIDSSSHSSARRSAKSHLAVS